MTDFLEKNAQMSPTSIFPPVTNEKEDGSTLLSSSSSGSYSSCQITLGESSSFYSSSSSLSSSSSSGSSSSSSLSSCASGKESPSPLSFQILPSQLLTTLRDKEYPGTAPELYNRYGSFLFGIDDGRSPMIISNISTKSTGPIFTGYLCKEDTKDVKNSFILKGGIRSCAGRYNNRISEMPELPHMNLSLLVLDLKARVNALDKHPSEGKSVKWIDGYPTTDDGYYVNANSGMILSSPINAQILRIGIHLIRTRTVRYEYHLGPEKIEIDSTTEAALIYFSGTPDAVYMQDISGRRGKITLHISRWDMIPISKGSHYPPPYVYSTKIDINSDTQFTTVCGIMKEDFPSVGRIISLTLE